MAAAVFGSAATNVSAGVGGSRPLAPDAVHGDDLIDALKRERFERRVHTVSGDRQRRFPAGDAVAGRCAV